MERGKDRLVLKREERKENEESGNIRSEGGKMTYPKD